MLKNKNHESLLAGLETNSGLLRQSFLFTSRYENHEIFITKTETDFLNTLGKFYKDINAINFEKDFLEKKHSHFHLSFKIIIDALKMRLYKMVQNNNA